MNNLKQMGMILIMYAQDYDDWLPGTGSSGEWRNSVWSRVYEKTSYGPGTTYGNTIGTIFHCPSSSASKHWRDYVMNQWMSGSYTHDPVRCGAITKPSTTLMIGDGDDWGVSYPPATIDYRHSGGANILFCDNHVGWYKEGSVTEDIIKGN